MIEENAGTVTSPNGRGGKKIAQARVDHSFFRRDKSSARRRKTAPNVFRPPRPWRMSAPTRRREPSQPPEELNDRHRRHRRPRDSRQPRQPDRRGRRGARGRLDGARRRAIGRFDRRPRSGGAARRRQEPLRRQGRHQGGRVGDSRHFRRRLRLRGRGADQDRRGDDRSRRHAQQVAAGRQRHSRRLAGGGQGGGAGLQPRTLPLCRRDDGAGAADADDEHPQRRRARRQSDRLPGIHDHAARRAERARGGALGRGSVPHPERSLKKAGLNTSVGDEGGFAPNLPSAEAALDYCVKAIETAGFKPGRDIALALDPAASEFFKDGAYVYGGEGKTRSIEEQVAYLGKLADGYPIVSIEDGLAEDDWAGWKLADRKARRQAAARRRRHLRHQCRAAGARHQGRRRATRS